MKKIQGMLVFALTVLCMSGTLSAAEYYVGTECVQGFSDTLNAYYEYNRAANNDSSARSFYCPINSTSGTSSISAGMYLIDNNGSSDFSCQLRAVMYNSTSFNYGPTATTSGSSTSPRLLQLGSVNRSGGHPYVYIHCSVPPVYNNRKSSIHTYFTNP